MSLFSERSAGICLPLSALRSHEDWGVGEFGDLPRFARWMRSAGLSWLALLPLNECALGQDSPYSTLSAFALDPLYLSLAEVEDFRADEDLGTSEWEALRALRSSPRVEMDGVRRIKAACLRRAHHRFRALSADSPRRLDFEAFRAENAAWLPDYALFRAIKEALHPEWWLSWPAELRGRQPRALEEVRGKLGEEVAFFEYVQWQAYRQMQRAHAVARAEGVRLLGDLPFVVAVDSADAWSRQDEFSVETTMGAPPDTYAEAGQDWGLPSYRWAALRASDFAWLRQRARFAAKLYDGARIDHVVGYYRSYLIPRDGTPPHFDPADEGEQKELGEAILRALGGEGIELVAEDLGTVPPFVRESLAALQVPGYRVLRWEKDGSVYRDPRGWPARSIATTGTHDTETLAAWWDALSEEERRAFRAIPSLPGGWDPSAPFGEPVHESILEMLYQSGSNLLLLPIQDLFGLRERINTPGTVSRDNWSFRLPWTIDEMERDPYVQKVAAASAERARRSGRIR